MWKNISQAKFSGKVSQASKIIKFPKMDILPLNLFRTVPIAKNCICRRPVAIRCYHGGIKLLSAKNNFKSAKTAILRICNFQYLGVFTLPIFYKIF